MEKQEILNYIFKSKDGASWNEVSEMLDQLLSSRSYNDKNTIMTDKWNKLRILTEWLEQGRLLELENVSYGISEEGNILRMYCEDKGVELPTLAHVWNLIEKLDSDRIFVMSSEVALTNINRKNRS